MSGPLPKKKFTRVIENFVCEQCGTAVQGDGYRNHCPTCLYSKHVDLNPGDRAADCGGLMKIADMVLEHGEIVLIHECLLCHHQKRNKVHPEDDITRITAWMANRRILF